MVNTKGGVAVLFPGQGAQYVGMGKELYEKCPEAREIFDRANRILGYDIAGLVFGGPEETLTRTANSQPAIFVTSYAAWEALKARVPWLKPRAFAGLSLGEYTALVAAGALSFEDGLRIVRKRGEYMEEACLAHPGTMASVIGLTLEEVAAVCESAKGFGVVNVANASSPGQVVISGEREAVGAASRLAKERGAKAVTELKVSGAFHSRLMESAERRLSEELKKLSVSRAAVPVMANFTGEEEMAPGAIAENLRRQVTGSVLWQKSMDLLWRRGVNIFVEVGCGKVLQGLVKRICPEATRMGVEDIASLEAAVRILEERKESL